MNCTNSLFISDASIDISILVIYFCIFRPCKGGKVLQATCLVELYRCVVNRIASHRFADSQFVWRVNSRRSLFCNRLKAIGRGCAKCLPNAIVHDRMRALFSNIDRRNSKRYVIGCSCGITLLGLLWRPKVKRIFRYRIHIIGILWLVGLIVFSESQI